MKRIKIKKIKLYKKLLTTSILFNLGSLLNAIAIKSNNIWMPVDYPKSVVNMYYLTDIFRLPFVNQFFSLGDIIIFFGVVYFIYQLIKKDYVK